MCSFQPTSSFKQVSGFHKDGLGANHPIFQPSSLRTPKISIKEFGDFLSDKVRKKNRNVVHTLSTRMQNIGVLFCSFVHLY